MSVSTLKKIKLLIRENGLKTNELGMRIGYASNGMNVVLYRKAMGLDKLQALAKELHVKPRELMDLKQNKFGPRSERPRTIKDEFEGMEKECLKQIEVVQKTFEELQKEIKTLKQLVKYETNMDQRNRDRIRDKIDGLSGKAATLQRQNELFYMAFGSKH